MVILCETQRYMGLNDCGVIVMKVNISNIFSSPFFSLIVLSLFLLVHSQAWAESKYVSDFLLIRIKDNIEQPYNVVTTVQTDDKVEVIDKQEKYFKIRTEDGQEGWILQHYLKSSLPKAMIIDRLTKENEELQAALEEYMGFNGNSVDTDELQNQISKLQIELAEAHQQNRLLQQSVPLTPSQAPPSNEEEIPVGTEQTKVVTLAEQELQILKLQHTNLLDFTKTDDSDELGKDSLLDEIQKSKAVIDDLTAENEELRSKKMIYLFMAGASVFLAGLLFGKIGGRRKNRYSY